MVSTLCVTVGETEAWTERLAWGPTKDHRGGSSASLACWSPSLKEASQTPVQLRKLCATGQVGYRKDSAPAQLSLRKREQQEDAPGFLCARWVTLCSLPPPQFSSPSYDCTLGRLPRACTALGDPKELPVPILPATLSYLAPPKLDQSQPAMLEPLHVM